MTMLHRWALTCSIGSLVGLVGLGAQGATEPGTLQNALEKPADCQKCHAFANPPEHEGTPNISPIAWQGTMMANSARDPVFWAGVALAHQDAADETSDCVRCHAPRAFLAGRGDAVAIDDLEPDDFAGVECDLCHRMIDDGVTPLGNARYTVDDVVGPAGDVDKQGPWIYEGGDKPMHGWKFGELLGRSEHCGTCHDVTTGRDRVDAEGAPLGVKFNEQRTYSEWKGSAYALPGPDARTCVDCHMPAVDDAAGCAEFNSQGTTHPTGGRRHDLAGANRRMVEILKGLYGDAGSGEIGDSFFDITLGNIDASLAAAATLEVTPPAAVDLQQGIDAWGVKVTNNTGHKLPTGYSEGRLMWLEVTATYGEQVIYSSGRWLPGQGLEGDPQQRTYEGLAVEQKTGVRFHLLRNDLWQVDTRIPPRGLKPDLETDPVGDRYTLLPDQTWPHWDELSYAFPPLQLVDPTPGVDDTVDLRVRLLYLINTPEYLQLLVDDNRTNMAGLDALALFPAEPDPLVLAEWKSSVPLLGLVDEPASSSGEPSTSEGPTSGGEPTSGGALTTSAGPGSSSNASDSGQVPEPAEGCGCRSTGSGLPWLLALAFARPRRRRR